MKKTVIETEIIPVADLPMRLKTSIFDLYPKRFRGMTRRPALYGAIYAGAYLVAVLISAQFTMRIHADHRGFVAEIPLLISITVLFFTTVYCYLWLPGHAERSFQRLIKNDVFERPEVEMPTSILRYFSRRTVRNLIYAFTFVGMFYQSFLHFVPNFEGGMSWYQLPPTNITTLFFWVPFYFSIGTIIAVLFTQANLINYIFTENLIQLAPLHEDRAGGMAPLGSYAFKLTIPVMILGVHLTIFTFENFQMFSQQAFVIAAIFLDLLFLILVPLIFYLPLRSAHKAMLKCRRDAVNSVSERHDRILRNLLTLPESDPEVQRLSGELNSLAQLGQRMYKTPIWPFNFKIQIGVIANAVAPVLLSVLLNRFFGLSP